VHFLCYWIDWIIREVVLIMKLQAILVKEHVQLFTENQHQNHSNLVKWNLDLTIITRLMI
jgi:hypothetical protein